MAEETITAVDQMYMCDICGNEVKVLEAGIGTLVCCGQNMTRVEE